MGGFSRKNSKTVYLKESDVELQRGDTVYNPERETTYTIQEIDFANGFITLMPESVRFHSGRTKPLRTLDEQLADGEFELSND